ncbi:MAG: M20/M25/M40 family metallo-hydrolase, partial [Bacteroidetes bacterium]|nr:M20/M25/M40 family metallo-hydrolase [Bacteroidota bacterium]
LYNRMHLKPEQGVVISVNPDIAAFLLKHPGTNISIRVDVERTSITCHNVIGYIDNGAPYTIIIGAHYDHLGLNKKGLPFNGADDNASGTALMMELARVLKQHGVRTNNFLCIAFSGEEEGLIGSGYFLKNPSVGLHSLNFMVNLDMVGRLGCEGNQVMIFGTGTSPLWHTMYKETPHPEFRISRFHGVHSFSDHLGFYKNGIPIISLTTGLHYDYHTTRDDACTLNYTGMVDIVKYLQGLLSYASPKGSVGFKKVPGWYDFSANFKIATAGIDHLLNVGADE